jgi:radical SAM superfamily enzyme YgiQ (UPF0313 family)
MPKASYTTLVCPPVSLAYLAGSLRNAGVRVTILDAVGEAPRKYARISGDGRSLRLGLSDAELIRRVPRDVTHIGVTCMFSESWPSTRESIEALGSAFPDAQMMVGGEHPTALPEYVLEDCPRVDVVALGEGEETIVELALGMPLRDVSGVAYRAADGTVVRTERRARIASLDDIPRPAWDLVPLEDGYFAHGMAYGIGRVRSLPLLATRGCPYQCTFCSSPSMWTTRWSVRSPDDVLDEMEEAVHRYDIQNFDFYDLTAILEKEWLVEFCEKLLARGLDVRWQIPSGTRSEALDREVLELLARAGVRHIVYAPESGSPAVLRRVKKKVHLERMTESMSAALAAGLTVKCNFVIGFPDETFEEAMETVAYCRLLASIGVQDVNLGPFVPYPGSALFDQLRADGTLAVDDRYFEMLGAYSDVALTPSWSRFMTDRQVAQVRWRGVSEFYLRSFAHDPMRLIQLPFAVSTGNHKTRLDRAVADFLRRTRDAGISLLTDAS